MAISNVKARGLNPFVQLSFAFEPAPARLDVPPAPLDCDDWLARLADFPRLHSGSIRPAIGPDGADCAEASSAAGMALDLPPALLALSLILN